MVSMSTSPVIKIKLVLSLDSLRDGWLSILGISLSICVLFWGVISLNMVSMSTSPVIEIEFVLSLDSLSNGWLFGLVVGLGLGKSVAILESTFNKMEKVSNELRFLLLADSLEEFSVHLILQEFIEINLKITL